MKKYFYSDGVEKFGPFSLEELKKLNLRQETKIWYYGLSGWTAMSEIAELQPPAVPVPPPLPQAKPLAPPAMPPKPPSKPKKPRKKWFIIALIALPVLIIAAWIIIPKIQYRMLYNEVVENAYNLEGIDFQMYVDKFYRDISNYGIYPQRPKTQIIKLADLSKIKGLTDLHGAAFGMDDDERIEIYINYESWKSFNKPKRYFLMYHELAHDVLNLEHVSILPITAENERKLMYPAIGTYEWITMDDFIESSHALFEEIAGNM